MRTTFLLGIIALLLATTTAVAEIELLEPTRRANAPDLGETLDELDEIFYLSRSIDGVAEYYLSSGSLGDTIAVHFQPIAPCSVWFAEAQWFSAGPFQAFIWEYSEDAETMYPEGHAPGRGTSPVSPIGDLLYGPLNTSAVATQDWETMIDTDDFLNGEPLWLDEGQAFMVGFVKTLDDGTPEPLADDVTVRGYSYTWFGGPWMDTYDYTWGGYTSSPDGVQIEAMIRVGVSYPNTNLPPFIMDVELLPDTPDPSLTTEVQADIMDNNGVASASLYWQVNDGTPSMAEMAPGEGFEWSGTLDLNNASVGDEVHYWVEATDNLGATSSSYEMFTTFEIVTVAFDRPILVVDYGSGYWEEMQEGYEDQWPGMITPWSYWEHNGVDHALIDAGWDAIIVTAFGSEIPSRDYEDDPYAAYLMNGGDLFYADQDYFYANGEGALPVFAAGDFAYDFLGITSGTNDPMPTDSTFYGEPDDPISSPFVDDPYELNFPNGDSGANLWTDFVEGRPGAELLFTGDEYGEPTGLRFETGYGGTTVFLSFNMDFAVLYDGVNIQMSEDWYTLIGTVIDALTGDEPPLASVEVGSDVSVVPAGGGDLPFSLSFSYFGDQTIPGADLWTRVTLPSGQVVGPTFQYDFTVLPYMNLSATLVQQVPGFAPPGNYQFALHAGMYPNSLLSDSFDFEKSAAAEPGLAPYQVNSWQVRGEIKLGDTGESQGAQPTAFALSDAWPNPFNPATTLTVSLPEAAELAVTVYNVAGQQVAELARGRYPAGRHALTFDASHLASGMYFVRAEAPGRMNVMRKVMLLR